MQYFRLRSHRESEDSESMGILAGKKTREEEMMGVKGTWEAAIGELRQWGGSCSRLRSCRESGAIRSVGDRLSSYRGSGKVEL